MKTQKLFALCLFAPLVFLAFAQLAAASQLTVIGQNNSLVDPSNVQTAINFSHPGDTIVMEGTFDFGTDDFVRIPESKEGMIIKGEIDPSGNRETNSPPYWLSTIRGGDTVFRSVNVGITIQDLYFNNTRRCVVFPNGSTGGDLIYRNNRVENVIPVEAPLLPQFFGYFAAFISTVWNPLTIFPAPNPIMGNLTIENNYVDLLNPTPIEFYPDYPVTCALAINLGPLTSTGNKLYVKIKNNILKNPGFAGISFGATKSGSGPAEYQVENNIIEQPLIPYDLSHYFWGVNPEGRGGGIESISLSNPSNVTIVRKNHMLNCGWGLLLVGMDSSIFDSNIVENSVPTTGNFISPIAFWGFDNTASYQNTNNIISNNTFTGTNQYGVGVGPSTNTPPVLNNIFVGNDFSGFTATTAQVILSSTASGNYFGPDGKNGIPGNTFGPLPLSGLAGIVDAGSSNSFVKNDFTLSGIMGKKYGGQVSVLLSETSFDDFVFESGMFPPGTGEAQDQVTNLGTNNLVVGHPANSVPDSKDRGIGQRLRAIEEQLAH
jgi:hypothetical protein